MAQKSAATVERLQKPRGSASALGSVTGQAARQVAPALDRLIHERMRLGIVSALAVNQSLSFNELRALLKTTDGNLFVHAHKLEEAAYITSTKSFDERLPKTRYRLTTYRTQGSGALPGSHGSADTSYQRTLMRGAFRATRKGFSSALQIRPQVSFAHEPSRMLCE